MNAPLKDHATTPAAALIPAFRPDGTVLNLAAIQPRDVDFSAMADALSKIARFNGVYRDAAYSVAQHSVMGADALFRETGDAVAAGYFVLHDGHEYLLGDWTRPAVDLLDHYVAAAGAILLMTANRDTSARAFPEAFAAASGILKEAVKIAKAHADAAILQAAGLPPLVGMPAYRRLVAEMDERMLRAEGLALFGPRAAPHLPAATLPPPRLTGAIRPWGAAKAAEAFRDRLEQFCGIVVR